MTLDADWEQFRKLVELVRDKKAHSIETKIGTCDVKIYRVITTIRIDLKEVA